MSAPPSPERALSLAADVVRLADGVPLQATVRAGRRRVTRLGNGHVLHGAEVEETRVMVRAVVDGREGISFTNDASADGLRAARDRAVGAARAASGEGGIELPGPAEAGAIVAVDHHDEATAEGDPAAEGRQIAAALDAARRADATLAGVRVAMSEARAVANTAGLERSDRATMVQARLIATAGAATGHAAQVAERVADLDVVALAGDAARTARAARDPHPLPPGRYDVVLEPPAVVELLQWLSIIAFGSRSWESGESFLSGASGDRITGDRVTLYDPGPEAALLPVAFDDEGVARRPVTFVDRGVAGEAVHDRVSAARGGCQSTGHWAVNDRFPSPGAHPAAVVFAAGAHAGDLTRELAHGLHVRRFHYVNGFLDPKKARMTGLTRDGVFEIRDGERVRAVRDLRFTEDILDAFARIDAVGDTLGAPGGFWHHVAGCDAAPAILLRDFEFTGVCE